MVFNHWIKQHKISPLRTNDIVSLSNKTIIPYYSLMHWGIIVRRTMALALLFKCPFRTSPSILLHSVFHNKIPRSDPGQSQHMTQYRINLWVYSSLENWKKTSSSNFVNLYNVTIFKMYHYCNICQCSMTKKWLTTAYVVIWENLGHKHFWKLPGKLFSIANYNTTTKKVI